MAETTTAGRNPGGAAPLVDRPLPPQGPAPDPLTHPVGWLRHRLLVITLGAAIFPLVVLFAIYFFDEFDTTAFLVLAPQIKHAFGLSDRSFVNIVALNLAIVLICAVPVGFYGDRLPRRKLVVAGAVVAGVFSFATGLAPFLWLFVLMRIGNGVGVLVNDPIHRSLLSDYYKPEARPTVFAAHANAVRWGAIAGAAVAGLVAFLVGWRFAFVILIVPIIAMAIVAIRLPDVIRGQSDDPESAAIAAGERPLPFGRAVRVLTSVKTLRWQFAAWVPIGAGYLPSLIYFPLFFDRVYHLNPLEIGLIIAGGNGLGLLGVQLAGRTTQRWLARDLGYPLRPAGLALGAVGPGLLLMALAHSLPVSLVGAAWAFFIGGMFLPPFLTVQALVSPARVRSLSLSFGAVFLVVGLVVFNLLFGQIADHSIRNGIVALVPFWVIGGLILSGARRFVTSDTTRAMAILATTAEMRRSRLAVAERSILSVRGVDVSYGPVQVLFGVNLELAEGEILALLGTNGAGKSTLLRAISGLVPVQGGAIFFDGDDITGLEPEDSFAGGLVQVPGGRGIFPGLTVRENLEVAAWASRRPRAQTSATVDELLHTFPALQRRYEQPAGVLSGGEQQMLTLGQAFISRPKLLMIDELSLGLAPIVVEDLLRIVRRIHEDGASVLLVEQSVNIALTVARRAVFMEKGEVRFSGPTDELLERDDILRAVFLSGAASLDGASA